MHRVINPLLHHPVEAVAYSLYEVGGHLLNEVANLQHTAQMLASMQADVDRQMQELRQKRQALMSMVGANWTDSEISNAASASTIYGNCVGLVLRENVAPSADALVVASSISRALIQRGHDSADQWRMSGREMFAEYCEWHGLINWSDTLWGVVQVLMARDMQIPVVQLGE